MKFRLPRPLSFAIPTAVLVIAAVSLQVGLPIYREQAAIATIERLGGRVLRRQVGPEWLRECIGEKRMTSFDNVFAVWLEQEQITDEVVAAASNLRGLEDVIISDAQITDVGIEHLERLLGLRNLTLIKAQVTDADISRLERLKNLEMLTLDGWDITDQGLKSLYGLTKLRDLRLHDTLVTEAGVAELNKALPALNVEAR